MQRYAKHRPTGFDRAGAFLPEQQDWLVAPVSQNRDSGALDRSNFTVALERLGGESDTVEVHRFGHWGPGWYEIILIDPADTARVEIGLQMESDLENYPVLNEEHFSDLEWKEATEYWARESVRGRVEWLQRAGLPIFAARRGELPEDPDGRLFELLTSD